MSERLGSLLYKDKMNNKNFNLENQSLLRRQLQYSKKVYPRIESNQSNGLRSYMFMVNNIDNLSDDHPAKHFKNNARMLSMVHYDRSSIQKNTGAYDYWKKEWLDARRQAKGDGLQVVREQPGEMVNEIQEIIKNTYANDDDLHSSSVR